MCHIVLSCINKRNVEFFYFCMLHLDSYSTHKSEHISETKRLIDCSDWTCLCTVHVFYMNCFIVNMVGRLHVNFLFKQMEMVNAVNNLNYILQIRFVTWFCWKVSTKPLMVQVGMTAGCVILRNTCSKLKLVNPNIYSADHMAVTLWI